MKIRAQIQGLSKLRAALLATEEGARVSMARGLERVATEVHAEAVKGVMRGGKGDSVTRYRPRREHRVSLPGDPFATDRGTGVASIHFEVDRDKLQAAVGSNLPRLAWLEQGTGTMQPRPWLAPAVQKVRGRLSKFFSFTVKGKR